MQWQSFVWLHRSDGTGYLANFVFAKYQEYTDGAWKRFQMRYQEHG
jgi:hypothetical protein